ncbi:MAG: fibronectin type III domain-containing protein [Pseudomonadota bacterium]
MKIRSIRVAAAILGTCLAITACNGSGETSAEAQQDGPVATTNPRIGAHVAVTPAPTTGTPAQTTLPVNTPVVVVPPVTPPVVPPVVAAPLPQPTTGSATLSWTPPTLNEDGSSLNNLAGYKIYFGTDPNSLSQSVQITNPGLTIYVMANLAAGTTYFAMSSYNTAGTESARSLVGSKTI